VNKPSKKTLRTCNYIWKGSILAQSTWKQWLSGIRGWRYLFTPMFIGKGWEKEGGGRQVVLQWRISANTDTIGGAAKKSKEHRKKWRGTTSRSWERKIKVAGTLWEHVLLAGHWLIYIFFKKNMQYPLYYISRKKEVSRYENKYFALKIHALQ
jgi:hypothetical protein